MATPAAAHQLSPEAARVVSALARHGMLMVQDAKLPSLITEVVGCTIEGSWWGHPANHEIFRVLNEVADHPDTFIATLLNKKRTLLHRSLFAPLVAIGRAREPWQMEGLPKSAIELLERVDRSEFVQATGDKTKKLELALLVASEEVHTESGAHAKQLTSWAAFAKLRKVEAKTRSVPLAKAAFEQVAAKLATHSKAKAKLPWF